MKESEYKSYDDLPLFLNSKTVAKVLGVSPSSGYELMHEPGFPVLRNGNLLFTLRPIQEVIDQYYDRQLEELELTTERQRVANLLREQESPA